MFAVDHILVSDELLTAAFACNLGACHGGCCVQGDSGAPLEPDERAELEKVFPAIRHDLRPEALKVIEREGVWEETGPDTYATTCVDGAECVFVTYDGPVAKCSIQKAYFEGRVDWPKPVSCHLYPIRVEEYGEIETLNYEQIDLCEPGRRFGKKQGSLLADYLKEPLIRKYGEEWYDRFRETLDERRQLLGVGE